VKNTADVTGNPIAALLQSISGVSAVNPLVAFYDIHGGKREALFFYFVPDTTRDINTAYLLSSIYTKDHLIVSLLYIKLILCGQCYNYSYCCWLYISKFFRVINNSRCIIKYLFMVIRSK
jgi:hypothetical protein